MVPAYKLKVHSPKLGQSESFPGTFELGTRENKVSFFLVEESNVGMGRYFSCHGENQVCRELG